MKIGPLRGVTLHVGGNRPAHAQTKHTHEYVHKRWVKYHTRQGDAGSSNNLHHRRILWHKQSFRIHQALAWFSHKCWVLTQMP